RRPRRGGRRAARRSGLRGRAREQRPRRPRPCRRGSMDAVTALRAGEVVILPTDTVYGLCSLPEHAGKLTALKQRPSMPIALVCADVATLVELVPEIPA